MSPLELISLAWEKQRNSGAWSRRAAWPGRVGAEELNVISSVLAWES